MIRTYLQKDPDAGADSSHRPGNEDQKQDPKEREDEIRSVGHGELVSDTRERTQEKIMLQVWKRNSKIRAVKPEQALYNTGSIVNN